MPNRRRASTRTQLAEAELQRALTVDYATAYVTVCLAATPGPDAASYQRLQLSEDLSGQFRGIVGDALGSLSREDEDGDLLLNTYEPGTRLLSNELEFLTIPDQAVLANQIAALGDLNEIPLFLHGEEFITHLKFYVIVLGPRNGPPLSFFRVCSQKQELRRSRWLVAMFANGQYDTSAQPGLLFDRNVDCFASGDHLFVLTKNNFQRIFNFFELVRRSAQQTLGVIEEHVPIANFDEFREACERHLHKLTKLNSISRSPYLRNITMAQLKAAIRDFELDIEVVHENGREKLRYNPRDKWALLKLLDDDFLRSIMTGGRYEATGKRSLDGGND